MKQVATMKRTDVILSVGTLALAFIVEGVIAATGKTDEFVALAWARHHNVLSWYVRPLFFLPFCYFAYKRSLWGIVLTLMALTTSMFWFPAPETTSPAVREMLASEREYLTANWTLWKVLIVLLVPISFAALGLAFWKRSFVWGLAVINEAVLFKVGWTFVFSTEAGAMSHLPAALLGLAVCDAVILIIGGTEDPFFSEIILRETAEKIPDAALCVYNGAGHGISKERKRQYEDDTLAFLTDHLGGLSGTRGQMVPSRAKEMG